MKFIADFHVHSRFSRATAKNLDLENLYIAAQLKGITVVGTGDFTHPGWFAEIKDKLVPSERGLFRLNNEISKICDQQVPQSCRGKVRFMLVSEISNIYKKNKKTRKNHNLVFVPDLEKAEKFNSQLDRIGNIHSDGRPILGLDVRNLLEILLDVSEESFLVPAHIWTPWFSLFGSKSGFDSMEECFEDLTSYIFAVETGLSSDPAMNRRISGLDGLTLISNSDAHSPLKLGREANLFNTDFSFSAIKRAIKKGDSKRFLGTFEFYPEEGKYHLDGHRKCNVRLWPEKTKEKMGICPVCQKPLTLGVMYRVNELADRSEGETPEKKPPFYNIIPLVEILSEVLKVGSGSKKVMNHYMALLEELGSELTILHSLKIETIERAGIPLLGEAVRRMRQKKIIISPGYDGEFGKIKIFDQQEREKLMGQKPLFMLSNKETILKKDTKKHKHLKKKKKKLDDVLVEKIIMERKKSDKKTTGVKGVKSETSELNQEQRSAVEYGKGPLMIVAGPGTGKTRTLTYRIAYLMSARGVLPENILAITFTNKAAHEMRERLKRIIDKSIPLPFVGTFHSFCFQFLNDYEEKSLTIIDDNDRRLLILDAIKLVESRGIKNTETPQTILNWTISAKQRIVEPSENIVRMDNSKKNLFDAVYRSYQKLLSIQELCDYEDLICKTVRLFETDKEFVGKLRNRFKYIFVDEYQDLNYGQYRMITSLSPPHEQGREICVIGDPDQSIYGFRGSDVKYFNRFVKDYPDATVFNLRRNYRSNQTILDASQQIIRNLQNENFRIVSNIDGNKTIDIIETNSERAEAVAVGKSIENLVGGIGFHSLDFGTIENQEKTVQRSFSDFAVLFRTTNQIRVFSDVFDAAGIPYQIVSRKKLFNEKGIKEAISFLKIIEGSGCYADFERIMNLKGSGFNKQSIKIFKNWCYQNNLKLSSALFRVKRFPINGMSNNMQRRLVDFIDKTSMMKGKIQDLTVEKKLIYLTENTLLGDIKNYDQKRKEATDHLLNISKAFNSNLSDFFAMVALQTDTDTYTPQAEKVALMTMHAAKGLEFPVVFISGCENGYLPFSRPGNYSTDVDEEKRLFYVAMTRAKESVCLTYAKKRKIYGRLEIREISPFVEEIEEKLKTFETSVGKKKRKKGSKQLKLF